MSALDAFESRDPTGMGTRLNGAARKASVRIILADGHGGVVIGYQDGTLRRWRPTTGEVLWEVDTGPNKPILCGSVDYESGIVYTGGGDGMIRGWGLSNGDLVESYRGHIGEVSSLLTSGPHLLLSTGSDKTWRSWDRKSGEGRQVLSGLQGGGGFTHHDSSRLITGCLDPGLGSWDPKLADVVGCSSKKCLTTSMLLEGSTLYLGRSNGEVMAFDCADPTLPTPPEETEARRYMNNMEVPLRLLKLAEPCVDSLPGVRGKKEWMQTRFNAKKDEEREEAAKAEVQKEAAEAVVGEMESMLQGALEELELSKNELVKSQKEVGSLQEELTLEGEERSYAEMQRSAAEEELMKARRDASAETQELMKKLDEAEEAGDFLKQEVEMLREEAEEEKEKRRQLEEDTKGGPHPSFPVRL